MGRQRGQTSARKLVLMNHQNGKNLREIGEIVNRTKSTV